MTILARLLSSPVLLPSATARARTLAAALAMAVSAVLLLMAAPAGAVVSEVETSSGKFATVGLQPRNTTSVLDGGAGADFANPSGNPVLHATYTYAIYWDPGNVYHKEWETLINNFLQAVGTESATLGNVFAVDAQYTDRSNQPASYASTFRGAYTDTTKYPTSGCTAPNSTELGSGIACLTDRQLQEQLQTFIAQQGLPKGMGVIYYLLTPPRVTLCVDAGASHCSNYSGTAEESNASYRDSFCSYHSDINPGGTASGDANTILYAAIPWTAGGLGSAELTGVPAYACQDGGFNATGKPIEQKEHAKEKNEKEKEIYNEASSEEKLHDKEVEALEGPHEEEPNQTEGTGEDGADDTGLADLIVNQIAIEQQNTVTDPLLNAWQGQDATRLESTDECRNFFAGGTPGGSVTASEETGAGSLSNQALAGGAYYLNLAFNVAGLKLPGGVPCLGGVALDPKFTAPNPVNAGDVVGFDGMESDITLSAGTDYSPSGAPQQNYATYTWNFGDGTHTVSGYAPGAPLCEAPWLSPCAASVFHSYQYGGTYEVTLTVRDLGGNTNSISHDVTVTGPPPPSSEPGSAGAPGQTPQSSSSATPATSPSSSTSHVTPATPAPVIAATIVPQTLHSALRKGLVVRYSVNEQVAGRFEVLLSRSVARKLGITGAPVTGMPAGTPAELVIAKAILVTTKGGRSAVHIAFSKRTAARLARAHKVSLMLRLVVRNAASSNPTTTTVVSGVTLGR